MHKYVYTGWVNKKITNRNILKSEWDGCKVRFLAETMTFKNNFILHLMVKVKVNKRTTCPTQPYSVFNFFHFNYDQNIIYRNNKQ